jgi:hypothetical protein
MVRVELLWFPGCPNADEARGALRAALAGAGLPPMWEEIDVLRDDAPEHARGYGSPTVLVEGRDVEGQEPVPDAGACCRVYPAGRAAPTVDTIASALGRATGRA